MTADSLPSDSSSFEDGPKPAVPPMDTPPDASTLGVKILLVSLTMLFGATLVGYGITRYLNDTWGAYAIDGMEAGLTISTAAVLGISLSIHLGLKAIQRGGYRALKVWMSVASVLSVLFVVSQILNWRDLIAFHGDIRVRDLSLFLFYGMTLLHALHVVGGWIPLFITTRNAFKERYAPARYRGVHDCGLYWHFIDAVWLVMAGVFLLG